MDTIAKNLDREVNKGKITEAEKAEASRGFSPPRISSAMPGADFAVEAVPEQRELKSRVLRKRTASSAPGVILATNTSSISMTELAAANLSPRSLHRHALHESGSGDGAGRSDSRARTSDATFQTTMALCEKLGKKPVAVNDAPGFVSNRVLMPMINEAAFAVMEGVATPEAVDAVMKLGMNHPMGPLELADFIGLDVCVDILDVLHKGFGDPKYRACPLLRKIVAAGASAASPATASTNIKALPSAIPANGAAQFQDSVFKRF